MAWISVEQAFIGGKLRKLYKNIGCSQNEAIGILISLWLWGIDNADDSGLIMSAGKDDVAEALKSGLSPKFNADAVVELLIENGWLDEIDGQLYLHDWSEWRVEYNRSVNGKRKHVERTQRYRKRKAAGKNLEMASAPDIVEEDPVIEESVELPEPAEPESAEPDNEPEKPEAKPKKVKGIEYSEEFEQFWAAYPRGRDKGEAYKKYKARLNDGYKDEELLLAAENYATQCRIRRTEESYIKHAKTFLGPAMPFLEYLPRKEEEKPPEPDFADGVNPFRL